MPDTEPGECAQLCGVRKDGVFTVLRQTVKKRMHAKLKEVKAELKRRMHMPINDVGRWLRSVVTGHFNYYGVPTNGKQLNNFRHQIVRYWHQTLKRRSHRTRYTWERMYQLADRWLPTPRITHPYPLERFGVKT